MLKVGNREKRVESSAWPLCSGLPMSAAECRAGKIHISSHVRMAVRGAPKRAGQALLSTLFSLFSTFNAKPPCGIVRKGVCVEKKGSRRAAFTRS